MIIIVEGIDRVGKTTLVSMLKEELNIPVYKNNTEFKLENMDNDNETDKMLKMLQICRLGNCDMIFDRFHWSDFVYGLMHRNYELDKAVKNKEMIEKELAKEEAVIVLVSPVDIEESSRQHGEDLTGHRMLFNLLFYNCENSIRKIVVNYNSLERAVEEIKKMRESKK